MKNAIYMSALQLYTFIEAIEADTGSMEDYFWSNKGPPGRLGGLSWRLENKLHAGAVEQATWSGVH